MFSKHLNPIFAIAGVATFLISLSAIFVWNNRNYQEPKPEPRFEELEIRGFDEVTSANDGEFVTISGFIDYKVLCYSIHPRRPDVCEGWFIGSSNEYKSLPIRIPYCSETIGKNCMSPLKEPENPHDIFVLDNAGKVIDIGEKLIEPPNTWTSGSQRLRLTGRITRVNGVGRFIEPIIKIESEQKSN